MSTRSDLADGIASLRKTASLPPWVKAKTFTDQRHRGDILSVCKGHPQKPVIHVLGQQDYAERAANADLICLLMSNLDMLEDALRDAPSTDGGGEPGRDPYQDTGWSGSAPNPSVSASGDHPSRNGA